MPVGKGVKLFLCLLSGTCKSPGPGGNPGGTPGGNPGGNPGGGQNVVPLPTKLDMPLLKEMTSGPVKNHVTSPFLMSMLMSQVWLGARGSTKDEMTPVFGLTSSHMASYQNELWKLNNAKTGVTTSVFNRVYHIRRFKIKAAYLGALQTNYGAGPKILPRNPAAGAKEINNLVSEKTQGNIRDLVTPNDLKGIVMVLFGAIYFKGTWLHRFKTAGKGSFLTPSGHKSVTMMEVETSLLSRDFKGFKAVALPYKDQDYSLIVLQPIKRTLAAVKDLQKSLATIDVSQIYGKLLKGKLKVTMPRFKVEAGYEMPQYFKKLGIRKIFDSRADFSGISREGIYVDNIIQKAMIEVNEEGTTAAAAAVVSMIKSGRRPIVVDRPFFAFVYQKQLKATLFAALVADPS